MTKDENGTPSDKAQTTAADALESQLNDVVAQNPGIVQAEVRGDAQSLSLDYDPNILQRPELERIVQGLADAVTNAPRQMTLRLEGRACESCARRVERKTGKLPGVQRVTATFLGGVMSVRYDERITNTDDILTGVRKLGVRAVPYETPSPLLTPRPKGLAANLRELIRISGTEVLFTVLCLLFLLAAPLLKYLGAPQAVVIASFILSYAFGGYFGLLAGIQSLRHLTIDIDLLMILASLGAAYVGAPAEGATLLFLFSLSNTLQSFAIERARASVQALMALRPTMARRKQGTEWIESAVEDIAPHDVILVLPGDRLPLDGIIRSGTGSIDQSPVTGESIPVTKSAGEKVLAGTLNLTGALEIEITHRSAETMLARMVRMVEEAQTEKAQTQRFLERAEQYYATGVLTVTAVLIVVPVSMGADFSTAFLRAMTAMVVASPCALIIGTPATILSAIACAARHGVLFKGGVHLETAATIETVAFDKTGTLTVGKPTVARLWTPDAGTAKPADASASHAQILQLAAAVEAFSEHPLARAIVEAHAERKTPDAPIAPTAQEFQAHIGLGASARVDGRMLYVGSDKFMRQLNCANDEDALFARDELQSLGQTCIFLAQKNSETSPPEILGILGIADQVRPDAAETLKKLREVGVTRIVMITGDNARTAQAIGNELGIREIYADLMPEQKLRIICALRERGGVAMVGDGINDAPALATASVGIALGAAGTDIALESADIVLVSNDLTKIPFAFTLSRQARRVVMQNLTFAGAVIVVLFFAAVGVSLPLTVGVFGHEGSTVLVCLNGLRLLRYTPKWPHTSHP